MRLRRRLQFLPLFHYRRVETELAGVPFSLLASPRELAFYAGQVVVSWAA